MKIKRRLKLKVLATITIILFITTFWFIKDYNIICFNYLILIYLINKIYKRLIEG